MFAAKQQMFTELLSERLALNAGAQTEQDP
jgi:hypothetical protein